MTALFTETHARADIFIDNAPSQTEAMIWIPGGTFRMGSDKHYPEEAPAHRVTVDGFWLDRHPVTNRQFREFVRATRSRHVRRNSTGSEGLSRNSAAYDLCGFADVLAPQPSGQPARLQPVVDLCQGRGLAASLWAESQHQGSRRSSCRACGIQRRARLRDNGPARKCPTEAEWEFAARGGLEDTEFAWGNEFTPDGRHMANTWQGEFPRQNTNADGFERTSPVTAFPPNGYGLHDMIGNVWEWTADWYSPKHQADAAKACCIPQNPRGGREAGSYDPRTTNVKIPRKVIKGGSHLCAPNYCRRYRPAARHAEPVDTSTSHLGFRCIRRTRQ